MLEVKGLVAGYIRGTTVLDGVDLRVETGARVALMGRNGMGKTLLAKVLIGLIRPSAGQVLLEGRDITRLPAWTTSNHGMAYVPQGREIFRDFTVLENLRMGVLGKRGVGMERLEQVLDWFPILRERANQRGGTLSGGQAQQLAIGRALISRPKLLVLDEPSEGIQPSIVAEIAETLRRISVDEGLTVFLIEQNIDLVEMLADRVMMLDHGRIAADFSVGRMIAEPDLVSAHMGL